MKKTKQQGGYTLVEMLVTVAIFGLAFVTIGVIFISTSAAQARASSAQRLLNEGNFILESITREIRMNAIDYSCAPGNYTSNHERICLRSVDGKAIHFRFSPAAAPGKIQVCTDYDAFPCTLDSQFTSLNPDFLTITKWEFHVYPVLYPLDVNRGSTEVFQPITTIVVRMETGTGRSKQAYDLQTAASSRVYNF